MAKSGRLELGYNICGQYRSVFNHCDVFGQRSNRIRWKTQKILPRSRSSKVIEVGTNQNPICDFLLVINSNWQHISYRCEVIVAYCSNLNLDTMRFWATLLGLGTTYDVHFGLIGKRVVDFLLVLIELFSLGVTAEALRAIIGSKSAISLQRGPVYLKFQVEGVAPTNHSFSQKTRLNSLSYGIKICTDFSSV